jgi:hypothetical protein
MNKQTKCEECENLRAQLNSAQVAVGALMGIGTGILIALVAVIIMAVMA